MSGFMNDFFSTDIVFVLFNAGGALYLLLTLLLLYLAKKFFDLFTPYKLDQQLTTKDNKAIALSFMGYLIGVGIILATIISGDSATPDDGVMGILKDIGLTTFWCLFGMLLLYAAWRINDKVLLARFDNAKELLVDQNIGTGMVECGGFIASALIIHGALYGQDSIGFGYSVLTAVIFFILGQIGFIMFGYLYQWITRFDLHEEIERDNAAAGVAFGFNLIAAGLLLSGYIKNYDSLFGLFIWILLSYFFLISCRYMVDKIILPKVLLEDEIKNDRNWGAALLEGTSAVVVAWAINSAFF